MKAIRMLGYAAGPVMLVVSAAFVFAQTTPGTTSSALSPTSQPRQSMVLQVGTEGRVLMRGTISAINTRLLSVKSWGGDWTVVVSTSTEILPQAAGNDLTKFKVGDFVGVQGIVNRTQAWTIEAKLVRDWTYRQEVRREQKQNLQAVRQIMKKEMPSNYQGTLSNLSGNIFTLTLEGTAYTVSVAGNAKILNRNSLTASLADFKDGDTVRVWGSRTDTTITAGVVRDVSLPRTNR